MTDNVIIVVRDLPASSYKSAKWSQFYYFILFSLLRGNLYQRMICNFWGGRVFILLYFIFFLILFYLFIFFLWKCFDKCALPQ